MYKKNQKEDSQSEDLTSKELSYEDSILNIQRKISLSLNREYRKGAESLVDKCVEVYYAIQSVDPQEKQQLHSVPGDFKRLVEKHFPELISKYSQVLTTSEGKQVSEFNSIIEQLHGELDLILENIKNRNYVEFANKTGFMKIRYSDKF